MCQTCFRALFELRDAATGQIIGYAHHSADETIFAREGMAHQPIAVDPDRRFLFRRCDLCNVPLNPQIPVIKLPCQSYLRPDGLLSDGDYELCQTDAELVAVGRWGLLGERVHASWRMFRDPLDHPPTFDEVLTWMGALRNAVLGPPYEEEPWTATSPR
jgi:hypothetical protein